METIAEYERGQVAKANRSGRRPVVFLHGLWLLPSSWDRWAEVFTEAGYAALVPGWPDDPETGREGKARPEVPAGKSIGQIADHFAAVIEGLDHRPAVIGHSFGGLLTEIVAGRGLSAASVAISPAPFRGVLPLPVSALKSSGPVLGNPANRNRAVPLTFDQFRYAFANAIGEDQAKRLFSEFSMPGSGRPAFQAATANIDPWAEAEVDVDNEARGPMLIVAGGKDHTVPAAIARAAYRRQEKNGAVTELVELPDRGHSMTIDDGWSEIANLALGFINRFV